MPTLDRFLDLLQVYNTAIWPVQVVTNALGLVAVVLVFFPSRPANRIILTVLSFFWLWTGSVFCIGYWSSLSRAAYLFGALFLVQGVLFFPTVSQSKLLFHFQRGIYPILGLLLVAYALAGYPLVGILVGHTYPRSLSFGVVPCPTTIFSVGMLLLTAGTFPRYLAAIPVIWSVFGIVPIAGGILEDVGLVIAGLIGATFIFSRQHALTHPLTP